MAAAAASLSGLSANLRRAPSLDSEDDGARWSSTYFTSTSQQRSREDKILARERRLIQARELAKISSGESHEGARNLEEAVSLYSALSNSVGSLEGKGSNGSQDTIIPLANNLQGLNEPKAGPPGYRKLSSQSSGGEARPSGVVTWSKDSFQRPEEEPSSASMARSSDEDATMLLADRLGRTERRELRLRSLNMGIGSRAMAGFRATAGMSFRVRLSTSLKWALTTSAIKDNVRVLELESTYADATDNVADGEPREDGQARRKDKEAHLQERRRNSLRGQALTGLTPAAAPAGGGGLSSSSDEIRPARPSQTSSDGRAARGEDRDGRPSAAPTLVGAVPVVMPRFNAQVNSYIKSEMPVPLLRHLSSGLESDRMIDEFESMGDADHGRGPIPLLRLVRHTVYTTLSEPDTSQIASFISISIMVLIFLTSVTFCLETMKEYQTPELLVFYRYLEDIAIASFTAEYVLRLITTQNRTAFLRNGLNAVDLLAIAPYYLELILSTSTANLSQTRIVRVVRLVRVFRVFKLGARFGKFQIVTRALIESFDMMVLLMFLLVISLIIFSTLMFYCERGTYNAAVGFYTREGFDISCSFPVQLTPATLNATLNNSNLNVASIGGADGNGALAMGPVFGEVCIVAPSPFTSIPQTFWWCIVTLMTVGYGDVVPVYSSGKIVAVLTMIQAVLLLSLPISVIGTEFTQQWLEYKNAQGSAEKGRLAPRFVALRKSLHAHNLVLDDILLRVRDMMFELEELSMRLTDKLRMKKLDMSHLHAIHSRKDVRSGDADGPRPQRQLQERILERRRLQNSVDVVHMEEELQQKQKQLQELLLQAATLQNGGLVRRLEFCRTSYYNLRRLWQSMNLLTADVDTVEQELEDSLKRALYVAAEKRRIADEAAHASTIGSPSSTRGSLFGRMRPKFRLAANVVAVAASTVAAAGGPTDTDEGSGGGNARQQRRNSDGEGPGSMRKTLSNILVSSRALLRPRNSQQTTTSPPEGAAALRLSIDASARSGGSRASHDAAAPSPGPSPAPGDDRSAEAAEAASRAEAGRMSGDGGAGSAEAAIKVHPAPPNKEGAAWPAPVPPEGGALGPQRSEPLLDRQGEEEVDNGQAGPAS